MYFSYSIQGNKNKRKIKEWVSWVFWIKIKTLLLLMQSHPTTNIQKWKINSRAWSTLLKLSILNLMIKIMLSKLKEILSKETVSKKKKKISSINFMLINNSFKIMISWKITKKNSWKWDNKIIESRTIMIVSLKNGNKSLQDKPQKNFSKK